MPTWFSPIYNETNAYWEVQLAATPEAVAQSAGILAREYIEQARGLLSELDQQSPSYLPLEGLLAQAGQEFEKGNAPDSDVSSAHWAKATRAFTRAQVRALQVIQALCPAPASPSDFGV